MQRFFIPCTPRYVFFLREDDKVIIGLIFTRRDGNSIIVRNHVAFVFCGKEYSCCISGDGPRRSQQLVLNEREQQMRDKKLLEKRQQYVESKRRKSISSLNSMEHNCINHALGQDSQNVSPTRKLNRNLAKGAYSDTKIHVASKTCGKEFSSCAAGDGPQKR